MEIQRRDLALVTVARSGLADNLTHLPLVNPRR
jgi:hypothetical protein